MPGKCQATRFNGTLLTKIGNPSVSKHVHAKKFALLFIMRVHIATIIKIQISVYFVLIVLETTKNSEITKRTLRSWSTQKQSTETEIGK